LFYSKGHACTALYSTLEIKGFFAGLLADFTKDGSYFTSHVNHHVPGVELSTGSLGHALGVACGTALAGRRVGASWKVFALLSDGELDEGSNWEALLFAPQHKLDNLCVVVDYNKIQSFGSVTDVLELHPLPEKFRAFRWNCIEVDGHDHAALRRVFEDFKAGRVTGPLAIVCHTVKGQGVSFMEGQLLWHYRSPDAQQASAALQELGFDA
jgi:transketolase